jgi:enoyl-CoA hydratase/carnithine racemase
MSDITISSERDGAVEIVSLARPDRLNALDEPMARELTEYFRGLCDRPQVRVVLLRGEGRAFCAGVDLGAFARDESRGALQQAWHLQQWATGIIRAMRACPQPIIGLGHGAAVGAGFSLLLACDVRYSAPSLKMNAAYIKVGLGGCDVGSSYFLPRLVGASVAAEYLYTGRFMTSEKAVSCGLVSELVEAEDLTAKGLALADEMCANSPMGLRMTKAAFSRNLDASSLDDAMAVEDRQQVMMLLSEDFAEAVDAFRAKRPPVYRDR